MKKTMGIFLMVFGAIIFVSGIWIYQNGKREHTSDHINNQINTLIDTVIADGVISPNETKLIEDTVTGLGLDSTIILKEANEKLKDSKIAAETELINQNAKNGMDFEKYIVKRFDKRFVKVKEWAGDKFVDGIYSKTNENPDLVLELKLGDKKYEFAVECKFRSQYFKGGVEFAVEQQIRNYKQFEKERGIPVFVLIGIGGTGANPDKVFIKPLRFIDSNFLSSKELEKSEKRNKDANFYYDVEKELLR